MVTVSFFSEPAFDHYGDDSEFSWWERKHPKPGRVQIDV